MFHAVADARRAVAADAAQLAGSGSGNNRVGLLRDTVLKHTVSLEHERARLARDSCGDALEADERRRLVAAIHHEVLDASFAFDVAGERLRHARAGELGDIRAF